MKIGILSMQEIINSGSFLQAYALKRVLENMGHEIVWKDYKKIHVKEKIDAKAKPAYKCILNKVEMGIRCLLDVSFRRRILASRKSMHFYSSYKKWLEEANMLASSNNDFKALVIGSDEVFNITQFIEFEDSLEIPWELYGEGYEDKAVISYAASAGETTYEKLIEYNIEQKSKALLSKLKRISVRDINTQNMLKKMGIKSCINIDPVLLYDFPEVKDYKISEKNYIVVYAYDFRINSSEAKEIINFARKSRRKLICINAQQDFCNKMLVVHPIKMLAYFKYADYIITDTFHGSVISIKYNKNFVALIRDSNKNKLGYLLEQFGLTERIVCDAKTIPKVLAEDINYIQVNKILDSEKTKAYNYFKEALV